MVRNGIWQHFEMGEKMKLGGPYTVEKGGTRDRVVVRDRQM